MTTDLNVSRETQERLDLYCDLVRKWNPTVNLVSRASVPNLWARHILDSTQIFDCAPSSSKWADLGTGGGFPGIVAAIMAAELSPETSFVLVESDTRKSAFLRTAIRETGITATVLTERIETLDPLDADTVTARALAALPALLDFGQRHMTPTGTCLFHKGATWKKEIAEARQSWRFDVEPITSKTDPEAVILRIRNIARV